MGHLWVTTKRPATRWALPVAAVVVLLAGLVPLFLPRPDALAGVSTLPWWAFALAFAAAEVCGLNLEVRGRRYSIALSGIPLAAGLYLSDPGSLLLGRLAGTLLIGAWYRRHTPLTLVTNAVAVTAGTTVAELLFRSLVLHHPLLSYPGRVLTLVAVVGAVLAEIGLLLWVHRAFDAGARLLARAVVAGVLGAAIGLIPALWIIHGEPLVTGAVLGPGLVLGFGAFASLSERHHRLRRMYELSDALAHAPDPARAIPLVLERSAQLLRAEHVELMLSDALPANRPSPGPRMWMRRAGRIIGPRTPGADLLERTPGRGELLAPLRNGGQTIGHLLVGERGDGVRGFVTSDLNTLQAVAERVAVALGNGHLLERLQFEARHDELTGLPNRLDFRAQLDESVEDLLAGGRQCTVMLLDFNGFKAINDTLGHQAGDQLLRELAGRFGQVAGKGVTIARLGGDEFAVLAPGMGDGAARALARRLLSAFDEPVRLAGNELRAGGSLGVAIGPEHGSTGAELLGRADVAMYVAKAGGGGYRMFTRSMDLPGEQVHTLAVALTEALRDGQIQIAVQPMVDLVNGQVHALEALARWHHPELGEVPPEDFFAAAERSGQVVELSRRVLDQALAAARQWQEAGQQVRVAINLAPGWLADPSLPGQIRSALARHGLSADVLSLEVAESDVIDEPEMLLALTRLHEMGARLSVDDFGTGYSSLTFVSRLPVDQIKIHQSFVQQLRADGRARAVVQSIIDLGRNLGLEVVAEGVIDAYTRIELKRMGCRFGQGYYFDAPMPVQELSWPTGRRPAGPAAWLDRPVPLQSDRVVGSLDTLAECAPTKTLPPSLP
ncbi:putative bifunctional diguanylate cyclase/phosphodiesterase [Kineosporia babensis]|uniref:EAL domain-containing protein n=1 Tax=Kineosporia babensis TaxID=499548 RepID=A0A9X1N7A1_9ACTN|nr:EAL domain-containing protein [Kineosporia babensis]MCD5309722.1 EAL domain-containing protein [Kineosporia babensis]